MIELTRETTTWLNPSISLINGKNKLITTIATTRPITMIAAGSTMPRVHDKRNRTFSVLSLCDLAQQPNARLGRHFRAQRVVNGRHSRRRFKLLRGTRIYLHWSASLHTDCRKPFLLVKNPATLSVSGTESPASNKSAINWLSRAMAVARPKNAE